jgi:predicted RNase H-like HicB family nuclease
MEFTVETHREDGSYWSEVREVPGCFASGWTLTELRESLEEGLGLCLEKRVTFVEPDLRIGLATVEAVVVPV